MNGEQKVKLTPQQINLLIQIINRQNFAGEQVELIVQLKQILIAMLKEKQAG
ncbi:MAG: hypothetical protein ABIJ15_08535 [bacterium]